jgi:signal transduction histidine kinase
MLQSLAGIALQCQAIASRCGLSATPEREELLALRREVEQHIREARQAVMDLRSPLLEKRGLAGALDEVGRRLVNGRRLRSTSPRLDSSPTTCRPTSSANCCASDRRRSTTRSTTGERRGFESTCGTNRDACGCGVSDNGCGFDVPSALSDVAGHYGVVGMRERAARLGGALVLTSTPQRGTLVDVHVPAEATPLAS